MIGRGPPAVLSRFFRDFSKKKEKKGKPGLKITRTDGILGNVETLRRSSMVE